MKNQDDIELDLEIQAIMWEAKINMAKELEKKKKSQEEDSKINHNKNEL